MQFISPQSTSRATSIFVIVMGLLVLCGWTLNINVLKSLLPGLTTMKPINALGFILGGISSGLLATTRPGRARQWTAQFTATLVLLLGIISFNQHLLDLDIWIDQLIFQVPPDASTSDQHPDGMTPLSSFVFAILGSSILLLRLHLTQALAQYLVLAVSIVPFLTLIGYLFGVDSLPFISSYKPMALLTVLGFMALTTGILATTLEIGILARLRPRLPSIVFGLALGLLMLSAIASILNTQRMAEISFRKLQMHEVLVRLEKVATEIEFNISAYRGFVLTGQDKFTAPLALSRMRINENLGEIRKLITNPDQLEKFTVLQSLINVRIRMCDDKIQLRMDKGLEEAAKAVATGQGEGLNKKIRAQMDGFIQAEKEIMAQIQNQARSNNNHALVALLTTLVTGLGFMLFVLTGLKQQTIQRKLAEVERDRLVSILEATTDLVSTADLQANLTYINRAGRTILGIGDKPVSDIHIPDVHPAWATGLILNQGIPTAKQQGSWQGETAVLTVDEREIPVSQLILAHYDEQGNVSFMSTIMRDISDLKTAQRALEENEHRYRLLMEYAPEAIMVLDVDTGHFMDANANTLNLFGMTKEQFFQHDPMKMSPVIQPDGRLSSESAMEKINEALAGGFPVFDWVHINAAGQEVPCEIRLLRIPVEGRNLVRGSVTDISERKRVENNLRLLSERQTKIASRLPGMIYQFKLRPDGTFCFPYASEAIRNIYLVSPESVTEDATAVFSALHPEDYEGVVESIRKSAETLEPWQYEYRVRYPDGTIRWLFGNSLPEREADGAVVWNGFITDITGRKEVENKLRTSEASLKDAQKLAQIGNWELDLVNNKLNWSEEVFRIFEIDSAQFPASYEAFLEIVHPDDRSLVNTAYIDSVTNRSNYSIVHRLLMADGRLKYAHERGETFYDQNKPIRSIGTVQDITQAKLAEEELRLYRNQLELMVKKRTSELEAVNQELEAFAYSVSHDLRAPLRGIDGFSQALIEDYADKLDGVGLDYLSRVRAASQRMGNLIDDLLKLSRITRTDLKRSPVDLSELAQIVIRELQETTPGHRVETLVQPGLYFNGNPGLLKVALENLIGNAWKYSARQSNPCIEFGSLEQNGEVVYYVSDNGVGFDMQYADKLFGAFQRLHHRDKFEGNGIGLATVKRIIHRHGGRIWAESEPDKKTTFYFTLANDKTGMKDALEATQLVKKV